MDNTKIILDIISNIILVIVLLWYVLERKIPLRRYQLIVYMAACFLVTSICDAGLIFMKRSNWSDESILAVMSVAGIFGVFSIIIFCTYCVITCGNARIYKVATVVASVAFVSEIAIYIVNYFTGIAFSYNNGEWTANGGYTVVMAFNVLLSLISVVAVLRGMTSANTSRAVMLLLSLAFNALASSAEVFFGIPVRNITSAIMCLFLYHFLYNPSNVIDISTKSFNRGFFGELVNVSFDIKKDFDVLLVAMDDFKIVNKNYGISAGDTLLFQVCEYLKNVSGKGICCRYGSDQFAIVFPSDPKKTDAYAETIISRFKHPWVLDDSNSLMMSATIGAFNCSNDAKEARELVSIMDTTMSLAKKNKKGGLSHVGDYDSGKHVDEKKIEKAIKLAIDRDEIMVYYQPIYSINKGCYNSAEALVRMNDAELGFVSPEIFIPLAERNGLIVEMGHIILEKVCKFIRDYDIKNTSVEYIEVNISPIQLMNPEFVDDVASLMEKYGVTSDQLSFEITETSSITNEEVLNASIAKLAALGITFCLDDYGSGNANIGYINKMPFKIIKLDKFIVWDSFKDPKASITLQYTISMLKALDLQIVAEGVETSEMRDSLSDMGCHYMQGWYYSKAVPDEAFIEELGKIA